jgi:hypothetical protein
MDRVNEWRALIKQIIRDYAAFDPSTRDVAAETIFDDEHGHYELVHVGWEGARRIHGAVIHVDIRDGRIWIQHDGTEPGIAGQLLAAGVAPSEIVMGFHPPGQRHLTRYATG